MTLPLISLSLFLKHTFDHFHYLYHILFPSHLHVLSLSYILSICLSLSRTKITRLHIAAGIADKFVIVTRNGH